MDWTPSLSDETRAWAEARAAEVDLPTADAFLQSLVDSDRERQEGIAKLRLLIEEAEASGYADESVEEIFDRLLARNDGD